MHFDWKDKTKKPFLKSYWIILSFTPTILIPLDWNKNFTHYDLFHLEILYRCTNTNTPPPEFRNPNPPLERGEEKFAETKRKRKELRITTTLSESLLTTTSYTRYHVSAKSRVSPSRVKKAATLGGRKEKKRKEGRGTKKKYQSGAHECPHPGKETGRTRFHDFKPRGKCGVYHAGDAFSLQRKPRWTHGAASNF